MLLNLREFVSCKICEVSQFLQTVHVLKKEREKIKLLFEGCQLINFVLEKLDQILNCLPQLDNVVE